MELAHQNIEQADLDVQKGVSDIQQASKMASLGFTVLGATIGGLLGGPIGLGLGLKTGMMLSTAVGVGFGIGAAVGGISGYSGSKIMQKVNSVNTKVATLKPEEKKAN